MRKWILTLALVLLAAGVGAQDFIRYYPPASAATGGMADPGSDGIMVRTAADTSVARSITSSAGTIVVSNADGVSGNIGLDVDTSIYGQFSSGTATVSGNCTLGDTYLETDAALWSMCVATNTWRTAVSFSETSTAGMGFGIDEDNMASDSATKFPSQQSVKAYVDANAGGTFDPATTVVLYEDFLTALTTSGATGAVGVIYELFSTGTAAPAFGAHASHPGELRLNSHISNDNSGASAAFTHGNSNSVMDTTWWNYDWQVDAVVAPGSNSTAITNTALYVGLMKSGGTPNAGTDGVWIRSDSDDSDGTFIFAVCNAAAAGCDSSGDDTSQKTVASTITPVAGTYYRFRIRRAASGVGGNPTIYMRVNDEAEKTFCSSGCDDTLATVPTGVGLTFRVSYLTRTTTGVMSADVDYMYLKMEGLDRY